MEDPAVGRVKKHETAPYRLLAVLALCFGSQENGVLANYHHPIFVELDTECEVSRSLTLLINCSSKVISYLLLITSFLDLHLPRNICYVGYLWCCRCIPRMTGRARYDRTSCIRNMRQFQMLFLYLRYLVWLGISPRRSRCLRRTARSSQRRAVPGVLRPNYSSHLWCHLQGSFEVRQD